MANLIGRLDYGHHAGTIHRLAHQKISSRLATWKGVIITELNKDGIARVTVNNKIVYDGNINKIKEVM
jgi:hypothetical protein